MEDDAVAEVRRGRDPLVEEPDQRGVAEAEDRAVQDDRVPGPETADPGLAEGRGEVVDRQRQSPCSTRPSGWMRAEARSPRQHWSVTATGFWVMWV